MKLSEQGEHLAVLPGSGQARISVAGLSDAFNKLFIMSNRPVLLRDLDSWKVGRVSPFIAAHVRGLLPLFVMAGNTVWSDLGETPFSVRVQDCPTALTGIELVSVVSETASMTPLMLAMMEAISLVADTTGIMVNDLGPLIARGPVAERTDASLSVVPGGAARAVK